MSVWLTIPSARPPAEVNAILALWRKQGYRTALWRDPGAPPVDCDVTLTGGYPGYAQAVNALAKYVLEHDPECDWLVAGGDDTEPDMNHTAIEIAAECVFYFRQQWHSRAEVLIRLKLLVSRSPELIDAAETFGIMQPTGDRFAGGSIDRIAGSPWLGREWCERANGGQGPFWPEFEHMFGDEALKRTAEKLGVYWMRPDLIHLHHHFMRASHDLASPAVQRKPPAHLAKWNSQEHWDQSKAIFKRLEAQDFEPCMPLSAVSA